MQVDAQGRIIRPPVTGVALGTTFAAIEPRQVDVPVEVSISAVERPNPKWGFELASGPDDPRASGRWIYPVEDVLISTIRIGPAIPSCIEIRGDAEFRALVEAHLREIRRYRSGNWILNALAQAGRTVTIVPGSGGSVVNPIGERPLRSVRSDGRPNTGVGAEIHYDFAMTRIGEGEKGWSFEPWMERPPWVGLFHELVHAFHYATGTTPWGAERGFGDAGLAPCREKAAIGLPFGRHDRYLETGDDPSAPWVLPNHPTENDLRREIGLPRRPRHSWVVPQVGEKLNG